MSAGIMPEANARTLSEYLSLDVIRHEWLDKVKRELFELSASILLRGTKSKDFGSFGTLGAMR